MANLFSTTSSRQHELESHNPALCEELRIRDILDSVGVMTNGTFVAAYELSGVHSYYHTEDMRNRAKESLEAVLRSVPERSMRLQLRFEIRQDTADLLSRYAACTRNANVVLAAIDEERAFRWSEKEATGEFLDYRLHAMFYWDPVIHQVDDGNEWEQKLRRNWSLSAGYLLADATVVSFPANLSLEGLQLPQVPRHSFTFQTRYSNSRIATIAFQGRASSSQFDDDLNQFRLNPYFTLDGYVSRDLNRRWSVFLAVENIFNQRYEVSKTPVTTLGPPILVRTGFRLALGAR